MLIKSKFQYNYYRYYDPSTGRYITSDPIGLDGGLNTYGYVDGNPVNFIDPDGRVKRTCPKKVFLILRLAVVTTCKIIPTRCEDFDSCNVIRFKIATKKLCILAQKALSLTCFPGNQTHKTRIVNEEKGLQRCMPFLKTCIDC